MNNSIHDYQDPKKEQEIFFTKMPTEKYEFKHHTLIVDSRSRDRSIFPNPNNYTIQFDNGDDGNVQEKLRNIVSIQLVDGHLPDFTSDTSNPYITLDIPELYGTYLGNNNHLSNTFAVLHIETKGTSFSRIKMQNPQTNYYKTPIAQLNKLTFQFKDYQGNFYDFGTDTTPPTDPDATKNHALIFKIITRERDFKILDPILT